MRILLGTVSSLGLLVLLAAPALPFLGGCDSSPLVCESTVEFEAVDTTPEGATLGATVRASDCVIVTYEGRRQSDGGVFDEGVNQALSVRTLIPGFQRGIVGRRTGESVRLTIPPELGYRTLERPGIPSCSVLEFDVTIVDTAAPAVCNG